MSSVTFPPALGGDGSTVTDDANATTGLANGGHRTRFVPALSQTVTVINGGVTQATNQVALATAQVGLATAQVGLATTQANNAAASAATALAAPATQATSTTSITVAIGSTSLTLAQTGKAFAIGMYVLVVSTANTANWLAGAITAYNSSTGAMTINVTSIGGSGTATAWAVTPNGPVELPSQAGNSGYVLLTNGSAASWGSPFPTQTGNAGFALVTNGTAVSWASIYPAQTGNSGMFLSTNGTSTSWKLVPLDLHLMATGVI